LIQGKLALVRFSGRLLREGMARFRKLVQIPAKRVQEPFFCDADNF